jgi:broad specificity phosphatase PhoE
MTNFAVWMFSTFEGISASIAIMLGMAALLAPDIGKRLIDWVKTLIPTSEPKYNWNEVLMQTGRAKNRVWILQTWVPNLKKDKPHWVKALAHEEMDFRVMLSDEKLIPFRLCCRPPNVRSDIPTNILDLNDLSRTFNLPERKPRLGFRFYSSLPFGPIYVVDGDIYWGLYLADKDSMDGPAFHYKASSKLGDLIIKSYEAMWEKAVGLKVSPDQSQHSHDAHEEENIELTINQSAGRLHQGTPEAVSQLDEHTGYLCILRHGDTDLNAAEIVTGAFDIGINAEGRQKAKEMRKRISSEEWHSIYSSPLRRCTETLIAARGKQDKKIELMEQLKERAMGDMEGYSKNTYQDSLPQYRGKDVLTSFHNKAKDGETYCDVFRRVAPLLKDIIARVKLGERILVCSHEGPIRMMLLMLDNLTIDEAVTKKISSGEVFWYLP